MASYSQPRMKAFVADAAIAANVFVKIGTDAQHVAHGAAGDQVIGIAMNAALAAGDKVEVALQGGGAKLKLGTGGAAAGKLLKSDANGLGIKASATDFCMAQAMETGVAGDIIGVEVSPIAAGVNQ